MVGLKGCYVKRQAYVIELVIVIAASFFLVLSIDALPFRSGSFTQDVPADRYGDVIVFNLLPFQTITGIVMDQGSVNNRSDTASSPWLTFYYPNNNIALNPNPVSYNYAEHRADFSFTATRTGAYYAGVATDPQFPDRLIYCSYSTSIFGIDPLLMTAIVTGIGATLTLANISFNVSPANKAVRKY